MILKLGYDILFELPAPVAMVALLNVHPSRFADLRAPDVVHTEPVVNVDVYIDSYGNRCARFVAPQGLIRLNCTTEINDSGVPDPANWSAREIPVQELPSEMLRYLLNSRYCEVDRFSAIALELFGGITPGWSRVQAVCDWVHSKVTFGYQYARPTKSALDVYTERFGVCRDFQHLAVTHVPRPEHSRSLCDWISGRHRRACIAVAVADGLQRVVRGLPRRPLVDLRCPPQ